MNTYKSTGQYDGLIKKIKRKKLICNIGLTVTVIGLLLVALPVYIEILSETVVDYAGWHPGVTVACAVLIFIVYTVLHAIAIFPLFSSLDVECDPQKYLDLNFAFQKPKDLPPVCSVGMFYLGDFSAALAYSEQMLSSGQADKVIDGIFCKARAQFFLGDHTALKETAELFDAKISSLGKIRDKKRDIYEKQRVVLRLLVALSEKNDEKIAVYAKSLAPWGTSKATESFINYMKGVSAYTLGDRKESLYRFMLVKDNAPKTVFARFASEYLDKIKADGE